MESNKDEAQRCLDLAKDRLAQGDYPAALKMVAKSKRLYPLPRADALEKLIEQAQTKGNSTETGPSDSGPGSSSTNTSSSSSSKSHPGSSHSSHNQSGTSHHSHSHSHAHRPKSESSAKAKDSSSQNHAAEAKKKKESYSAPIRKILDCKSYYEVLELEKDCSDIEIKKAYRKLALQYHPDKNSEPGADEAFKVISESFSVLSDKDKRRRYDMVGPERNSSIRGESSFRDDVLRNHFAAEMNPEDLFDIFFNRGAGLGRQTHFRTYTFGGPPRQAQPQAQRQRAQQDGEWNLGLLQFLPLLFLLFFSLFSGQGNVANYSLNKIDPYVEPRFTTWNHVPYFVSPQFDRYQGSDARYVRKMEMEIEDIFKTKLQNKCYSERIAKRRVPDLPTPSCDKLSNFNSAI